MSLPVRGRRKAVHGTASLRQLIVDVLTYCWNVRNVMLTVPDLPTFEELCDAADNQLFNCRKLDLFSG